MYKNKTLLLKMFESGRPTRPIFQYLSPLFFIKIHRINQDLPLKQMLNNHKMNYTPNKMDFDRVLILHSSQASNARRSVFINNKRSELIEFINQKGNPGKMYILILSQINQFVPTSFLINQMQSVFNFASNNSNKKYEQREKQAKGKVEKQKKQDMIIQSNVDRLKEMQGLIINKNLNSQKWKQFLETNFSKKSRLNNFSMEESYINLQIFSIYMVHFSSSPQWLYEDLKQFSLMLQKFNFIRYFWDVSHQNQFIARKYCERLIKSIKWRTSQSEQYLLMLVRMHNWQRFFVALQDYCLTYEKLRENKCSKTVQ